MHKQSCTGMTAGDSVSYVVNHGAQPIQAAASQPQVTTPGEAQLTSEQVKTELADLNAPTAQPQQAASADLHRFEAAAAAADAPTEAAAAAPADPAAVMALADLAISALSQLAPSQVELPEHLCKLTPQERAILNPFAIKAAPKFAEATAKLDQYAHLVFVGLVGWFGFVRWRAIEKLTKMVEARNTMQTSPERDQTTGQKVQQDDGKELHPGQVFGSKMPGSPF
jgi:hypothetical protein